MKISKEILENSVKLLNAKIEKNGKIYDKNGEKIAIFLGKNDGAILVKYVNKNVTHKLENLIKNSNDFDINFNANIQIETKEQIEKNNNSILEIYNKSILNHQKIDNKIIEDLLINRLNINDYIDEYLKLLDEKRINIINSNILLKNDINYKSINYDISINNLNQDIEKINIRYKHQELKGWRSPKNGNNSGFYFENNIKKDTLIIVEGAKDGINTNIATDNNIDVFSIDSKDLLNNQKLKQLIKDNIYKQIFICLDKDFSYNKDFQTKQYELKEDEEIYQNINDKLEVESNNKKSLHVLKWGNNTNNINADMTDIIKYLNKNDIKLIDYINKNSYSFKFLENKINIKKIRINFNKYKNNNKYITIEKLKSDYLFLNNIKEDTKKYISLIDDMTKFFLYQRTFFQNKEIVEIDKFVTEKKDYILDILKKNKINLLNAPAGSGKSHLIKEIAKKNKVLIISPLESITKEFINEDIGLVETNQFETDLNSYITNNKSVVLTTDTYTNNLISMNKILISNYFNFIVFDEQHLVYQAHNFRKKVLECYENINLKTKNININSNIILLSATPINDFSDYKTIEIKRKTKTEITYKKTTNKNIEEILANDLEKINNSESILFYIDSLEKFNDISRVIKAMFKIKHNQILESNKNQFETTIKKEDIVIVGINSEEKFFINHNDFKTKFNDIKEIEKIIENKRIIYLGTSKIATGVNLKNLKSIIQYGTAYNPENLIQLYNRLRSDGNITNINLRENQSSFINLSTKAKAIENAIFKVLDICDTDSLAYALKQTKSISHFKEMSNIKNINLDNIFKEYKEELLTLQAQGIILIKGIKNKETNIYQIVEIERINYLTNENIDKHNINKKVDLILSKWGEKNIIKFNNFFNSSQIFTIDTIENSFINSVKTKEATEEKKISEKEIENKKKELLNLYFDYYTTHKSDFERTFKLLKNINIVELERLINKSIENKEPIFDYGFKVCRYAKDFDKYINIKNGFTKTIIDIINNSESNIITLKEIEKTYLENGENIKLIKKGNSNILKELIFNFITQNLNILSKNGKIFNDWEYIKSRKTINKKAYLNFIIKK